MKEEWRTVVLDEDVHDLREVRQTIRETPAGHVAPPGPQPEDDLGAWLADRRTRPGTFEEVLLDRRGDVAGALFAYETIWAAKSIVYVEGLFVPERLRRLGLARRLLDGLAERAAQGGAPGVVARVPEPNLTAQLALRKCGFSWIRTVEPRQAETGHGIYMFERRV